MKLIRAVVVGLVIEIVGGALILAAFWALVLGGAR